MWQHKGVQLLVVLVGLVGRTEWLGSCQWGSGSWCTLLPWAVCS
jgi:hypothetical protein